MYVLIGLILFVVLIIRAFLKAAPKPECVIAFSGGDIEVKEGSAPRGFVPDCKDMLRMWKNGPFPDGEITVHYTSDGYRLTFSDGLPESWHQRLRNVWFAHCDKD